MTEFEDTINRWIVDLPKLNQEVFTGVVDLAHESIQTGSVITGSPGQPVDTGRLRASWQKLFISPTEAEIGTNVDYAPYIEEGMNSHGGFTLQSEVGGFHSIQRTIAGLQRITDYVVQKIAGSQ